MGLNQSKRLDNLGKRLDKSGINQIEPFESNQAHIQPFPIYPTIFGFIQPFSNRLDRIKLISHRSWFIQPFFREIQPFGSIQMHIQPFSIYPTLFEISNHFLLIRSILDVSNYGWISQKWLDMNILETVARRAKRPKNKPPAVTLRFALRATVSEIFISNHFRDIQPWLDKLGMNWIKGNGWINPEMVGYLRNGWINLKTVGFGFDLIQMVGYLLKNGWINWE